MKNVVFVGDRGMVKAEAKKLLANRGFEYITALTDPQIRARLKAGTIQIGLFDKEVQEIEANGIRYVLRCNPYIKRKEQERRNDKLRKLSLLVEQRNLFVATHSKAKPEKGLKLHEWIRKYKLSSFVSLVLKDAKIIVVVDQSAKDKDSLLDGCYAIITNVSANTLTTTQVHSSYINLQKVERDLRTLKTGLLEVRPIFLRKADRTKAHVFITMLALKITRKLNTCLSKIQTKHFSIDDALSALSRLCLLNYKNNSCLLTKIPQPDALQAQILAAFSAPIPQYNRRQSLK